MKLQLNSQNHLRSSHATFTQVWYFINACVLIGVLLSYSRVKSAARPADEGGTVLKTPVKFVNRQGKTVAIIEGDVEPAKAGPNTNRDVVKSSFGRISLLSETGKPTITFETGTGDEGEHVAHINMLSRDGMPVAQIGSDDKQANIRLFSGKGVKHVDISSEFPPEGKLNPGGGVISLHDEKGLESWRSYAIESGSVLFMYGRKSAQTVMLGTGERGGLLNLKSEKGDSEIGLGTDPVASISIRNRNTKIPYVQKRANRKK